MYDQRHKMAVIVYDRMIVVQLHVVVVEMHRGMGWFEAHYVLDLSANPAFAVYARANVVWTMRMHQPVPSSTSSPSP